MTQQQLVAPHKILVTGASGFVGRFLCEAFSQRGVSLRAAVRKEVAFQLPLDVMVMGNMAANTDWSQALKQVSVVVLMNRVRRLPHHITQFKDRLHQIPLLDFEFPAFLVFSCG